MNADTILAVASPPGRSARGIVRIGGTRAFDLVRPHLQWSEGDPTRGFMVRTCRMRLDAASHSPSLPCLVTAFTRPASYTGEDGVEILLPGNPGLLERVMTTLLASGSERGMAVRHAEPGEFTARAFMNGRISLAAAEGVAATIAATCDAQLRAAHYLGAGRLARHAQTLADDLTGALALVEAGIDFTDQEDVVPIGPAALGATLVHVRTMLGSILERAVGMESLEAVPWVVFSGAPNAGKSTLFNALLGHSRAVVSGVAGTTRDVIAEPLALPDASGEVMLVDVAGHDADTAYGTESPASRTLDDAMRARAHEAVDRAELVLHCVPVDAAPPPGDARADTVIVRTMADRAGARAPDCGAASVVVSAITGVGLDDLRAIVARRIGDRAVSLAADSLVVQPRHQAALAQAREAVDAAATLLDSRRADQDLAEPELIAAAMRGALDALGAVTGEITPDDVLDRVFATFCVGK